MLKDKLPIFLINTLLLCIPLSALTDGQNDGQRNKYTCCAWAGGTFFPVVLLCQFLALAGKRFWFYILLMQSTIQFWCCVSFLVLAGNSFWCCVRTQCTIKLCGCVSFLVVAGNNSQNENMFLQKNLIGSFYCDPLLIGFHYFTETTLQPRYVSCKIQTFYYCISLSCIVQIYILTIPIFSQKYQGLSVLVEIGEKLQYSFKETALQSQQYLKNIKSFYSLRVTIGFSNISRTFCASRNQ